MPEVYISVVGVLIAGIANMVIGMIWYAPPVFGTIWRKLSGVNEKSMQKNMAKMYVFGFIAALISSYVLAHVVGYVNATSMGQGVQAGFWMWLGFVAPITAASVLYEGKPIKLYLLNNGFQLVALSIMGAILALWT